MGYTSQQGQVGFGLQSVKGTPVAATRFARLRRGSLAPNRDLMIPDPEIGGNRDVPQAYLGPIAFSGSYEFYARMQLMALFLRGALGAVSSTTTAGQSEEQTITITGTPTGGTFTLSYRGQTTAAIAYNATSAAVVSALEALSTIGVGGVTGSGGPLPGSAVVIAFAAGLANQNARPITGDATNLTGGTNPAIAITETTPGYAVRGVHVITPSDASSLPWLSVEERLSVDFESFRYTDAKIARLQFECDADGYMGGTVDMSALRQVAGFTAQANPTTVDTSPMITGSQVFIYWNGIQLPAKSMNFEIQNNMEDDDFRLGSFTLGDLTEKRRMFTMGCTVRPDDAALWREATYGGSALTEPRAGQASLGTLSIVATTFEDIQGADTPFRLQVDVPYAAMAPFAVEPSGDDVIEHEVNFTLLRDDPLAPIATFTVVDDLATVS
jgi:hypothetical protein